MHSESISFAVIFSHPLPNTSVRTAVSPEADQDMLARAVPSNVDTDHERVLGQGERLLSTARVAVSPCSRGSLSISMAREQSGQSPYASPAGPLKLLN